MDHLIDGNWKRGPTANGFRESFQCHAADIECFGLPHFGIALGWLKLAGAEESRAPFFG